MTIEKMINLSVAEDLVHACVDESPLSQEESFRRIIDYVLVKNEELYLRLA